MTGTLLTQQPAPVTRRNASLTGRFLSPSIEALADLFLQLRAEADRALRTRIVTASRDEYPLGRCREITFEVLDRLSAYLATNSSHRGARALHSFLAAGGVGRCVWGVLRDRYFQTALQFGGLYVDVSNDTVVLTKPKVEILPMEDSGLVAVRGARHFARIAESYWGVRIYANHALPTLSPMLPMIVVADGKAPALQSATGYMTELFRRDGFLRSQRWLTHGPPPPPEAVEELRARCPEDILAANPYSTGEAAIDACRQARASGFATNAEWHDACVRDYARIHPVANDAATPARSPVLTITWRADGVRRRGWRQAPKPKRVSNRHLKSLRSSLAAPSQPASSPTSTTPASSPMPDPQIITIDGREYPLDNLSETAKEQLNNVRFTDQEIARLQSQLSIFQTARGAYAGALKAELEKGE